MKSSQYKLIMRTAEAKGNYSLYNMMAKASLKILLKRLNGLINQPIKMVMSIIKKSMSKGAH